MENLALEEKVSACSLRGRRQSQSFVLIGFWKLLWALLGGSCVLLALSCASTYKLSSQAYPFGASSIVGTSSDRTELGDSPLHYAVKAQNFSLIRFLLKQGADPFQKNELGLNPVDVALYDGLHRVFKVLLKAEVVQGTYPYSLLALQEERSLEAVKVLLQQQTLPPLEAAKALRLFAFLGNLDMVLYLLEDLAYPDIEDQYGGTALHYAITGRQLEVVKYLIEVRGYDVQSPLGTSTPLMLATYGKDYPIFAYLIAKGASVNVQDAQGNTALMLASERGFEKGIPLLLQAGGLVVLRNNEGLTLFHYLAQSKKQVKLYRNLYNAIYALP